jgi:hypothetical protein
MDRWSTGHYGQIWSILILGWILWLPPNFEHMTLSSALAVNISFMMWMMLYLPLTPCPALHSPESPQLEMPATGACLCSEDCNQEWNPRTLSKYMVYCCILSILAHYRSLLIFYRQYISPSLWRNSLNYEKEIGLYICPYIHQRKNIKHILVASKTSLWFQYLNLLTTMHV